jgi:tetratricopeptide (TPR) repeat protein
MYVDAAKTYMKLTARYLDKFQYEKCIEIINSALDIYKSSSDGDNIFEIEMLYQKAVMLYGIGHTSEPLLLLENALEISKTTGVYFKADEVYMLIASIYLFQDKYTDFIFNINKARQFAEFTENC